MKPSFLLDVFRRCRGISHSRLLGVVRLLGWVVRLLGRVVGLRVHDRLGLVVARRMHWLVDRGLLLVEVLLLLVDGLRMVDRGLLLVHMRWWHTRRARREIHHLLHRMIGRWWHGNIYSLGPFTYGRHR
jgi:hypothetical protein